MLYGKKADTGSLDGSIVGVPFKHDIVFSAAKSGGSGCTESGSPRCMYSLLFI